MIDPRPSVTRFVKGVAHAERARGGSADGVDVAQRILTRLHEELGKLIGSAGFDILVARALVLARRTHPVLDGVTASPDGRLTVEATASDPAALQEGSLATVEHFMELLVVLIGEDLAMRLVRNIWPAASHGDKK